MKNIVLLLVALATILGIAAATPVIIDPNFELLKSGQSYDYANYGAWHAKAFEAEIGATGADGARDSANNLMGDYGYSKLLINGAVVTDPQAVPAATESSYVENTIETLVFGDFVEADGKVQTARTGYYMGGSLYSLTKDGENAGWDPENDAMWDGDWSEKAGFTKDAYGWFSGKLGGVDCQNPADQWYNDAQFMVILPGDNNQGTATATALVDTTDETLKGAMDTMVLKIVAHTDRANQGTEPNTKIYEAYAGASQTGDIKIIPGDALPRVSGYGEVYGGFTDAWMPTGFENRIEFETANEVGGEPFGETEEYYDPRAEWDWWTT